MYNLFPRFALLYLFMTKYKFLFFFCLLIVFNSYKHDTYNTLQTPIKTYNKVERLTVVKKQHMWYLGVLQWHSMKVPSMQNRILGFYRDILPSRQRLLWEISGYFSRTTRPHSACDTTEWLHGHRVHVLDWPASSPNLSLFENIVCAASWEGKSDNDDPRPLSS